MKGYKNTLRLAKRFIKSQSGYTVAEIDRHYLIALRDAKTPETYAEQLEEYRRVKNGFVAPWMNAAEQQIAVDWATPGADISVEVTIENGRIVSERVIPPNTKASR